MSISILYTRVSSVDQKTDRQRVKENEFDKVIEDKCSGAIPIFERPEGSTLKTLIGSVFTDTRIFVLVYFNSNIMKHTIKRFVKLVN